MTFSTQYLQTSPSSSSSTPSAPSPSTHPAFTHHSQRLSSLLEYVTMQHQKSRLHQLKLSLPPPNRCASTKKDPMEEAILKGQFLD